MAILTWQERIRATGLPNDRWNWRRVQAAHRQEIAELRAALAAKAVVSVGVAAPEGATVIIAVHRGEHTTVVYSGTHPAGDTLNIFNLDLP